MCYFYMLTSRRILHRVQQWKEKLKSMYKALYGCIKDVQHYARTSHNVVRMQWLIHRECSWQIIRITDYNHYDYA